MSRNKNKNKANKKVSPKLETIPFVGNEGLDESKKSDSQEQNELKTQQSMNTKNKSEWLIWNKMETINALLAIGTFLLFGVAWYQSKLTEKSANAAIEAVKLSSNQFETENTPYLMVKAFDTVKIDENKPVKIYYRVTNLRNGVAKVDSIRAFYSYAMSFDTVISIKNLRKGLKDSNWQVDREFYVTNLNDNQASLSFKKTVSSRDFNLIKYGYVTFALVIEIRYVDTITGNRRVFREFIRSMSDNPKGIDILQIENYPISKK